MSLTKAKKKAIYTNVTIRRDFYKDLKQTADKECRSVSGLIKYMYALYIKRNDELS